MAKDTQPTDTLFQTYGRDLYKTGVEDDPTTQMLSNLNSNQGSDNSANLEVGADTIGSGVDTSTTDQGVGYLAGGKTQFDNTQVGYILGIDKGVAKFYLGNSTNYISFDGTSTTIVGGLSVSSLNIPDSVTANSMHVDVSGNTWWGANVATGYAGANAYILATGAAVFKSVSIGGSSIQYQINNSGIFSFGDGSDGSFTTSGDVTLTSDKYYTDLTIQNGHTFKPNGYRVFCTGTLTISGTGKISGNGNNGTTPANDDHTAGLGGVALPDGYLKGSLVGGAGGDGAFVSGGSVGANGVATSNSLGSSSGNAGKGGDGNSGVGFAGGTGALATISNVKLIANWHLATMLDISSSGSTVKFDNSASAPGGGGGGRSSDGAGEQNAGSGGGGGGSDGRILAIYARNMVIGASASITSNGGNAGNGGARTAFHGGGGGGGTGGNGGIIVLVYNTITNSGSITVTKGNKGIGGTSANANPGVDGTDGVAGIIYQFQLSL